MKITDDQFFEIVRKHVHDMMKEVNEYGTSSPYQWTKQLGNMNISILMSITDKMPLPRREAMDPLTDDLIQWILEQKEFQIKYDGVPIEDVRKDMNKDVKQS